MGYAFSNLASFIVVLSAAIASANIPAESTPAADAVISGRIEDYSGSPVPGVTLVFRGTGASAGISRTATSDSDGTYAQTLPAGWSGSVASDENYRLDPPSRAYTSFQARSGNQNYIAYRNWYAAPTGRDTTAGTFEAPFKTPQKAADRTNPGDTVYIREGIYEPAGTAAWDTTLRITRSGQPGRPITFRPYDDETVIFTGAKTCWDAVAVGVRPSDQRPSSGQGVEHIVIEGLIFEGGTKNGLAIYGPVNLDPPTAHIIVRRCVARNNIGGGIGTRGKVNNVTIEWCEAYENQETGMGFGRLNKKYHADEPEDDMNATSHSTIRHCLSYNNEHPRTPGNTDGIGASHAYRCTFEDNVVFGNSDDGIDIYASVEATLSRNIVFGHRHLRGNGVGIKVSAGGGGGHLLVRNIAFDNKSYGLEASSPSLPLLPYRASTFYHNLAYRTGSPAISIGDETAEGTWVVHNNIGVEALGRTDFRIWSENVTSDHNVWRSRDLSRCRMYDQDENSLSDDPGFIDPCTSIDTNFQEGWTIEQKLDHVRSQVKARFALNSTSPCRNAGKDIGFEFNGSAPDIGPYESE